MKEICMLINKLKKRWHSFKVLKMEFQIAAFKSTFKNWLEKRLILLINDVIEI